MKAALFNNPQAFPVGCGIGGFCNSGLRSQINAVGVEAVTSEQFLCVAVRNDLISYTHTNDLDLVLQPVSLEEFKYSRPESAREICFFDSNDDLMFARCAKNGFAVERFDEPGVNNGCLDAVICQSFGGIDGRIDHRAVGENSRVAAFAKGLTLA